MKNYEYLKSWDDYSAKRVTEDRGQTPILLPVHIDLNERGEIVRERMKSAEVKKLYAKCRKKDFPAYMKKAPKLFDRPDDIFNDYLEYFGPIDGVEGPGKPSPLDFNFKCHVWILFHLPKPNWKFSGHRQYSVENDMDDLTRNYEKICTMDDNNALLVSNRCRSNPKGLKYNLHVSINQTSEDGKPMCTDIIIDPGSNNEMGPPWGDND